VRVCPIGVSAGGEQQFCHGAREQRGDSQRVLRGLRGRGRAEWRECLVRARSVCRGRPQCNLWLWSQGVSGVQGAASGAAQNERVARAHPPHLAPEALFELGPVAREAGAARQLPSRVGPLEQLAARRVARLIAVS